MWIRVLSIRSCLHFFLMFLFIFLTFTDVDFLSGQDDDCWLEGFSGFSCTRQLGELKGCGYVYSLKQKHKTKMWWMSQSSFHCSRFWQNGHLGPEGWLPGVALHGLGSGCLFLASFLLHLRKKHFGILVFNHKSHNFLTHCSIYTKKISLHSCCLNWV